jgi:hypothetical protein
LRENENYTKQQINDVNENTKLNNESKIESNTTNLEERYQLGGLVHEKEDFNRQNSKYSNYHANNEDFNRYNNHSSYRKRSFENDDNYNHRSSNYNRGKPYSNGGYKNYRGGRGKGGNNNWKRDNYY